MREETINKVQAFRRSGYSMNRFPPEIIYELDSGQQGRITDICGSLPSPGLHELDEVDFFNEVALANAEVPRPIRKLLNDFGAHSNRHGALLIRGLPTDPSLPPTPVDDGNFSEKRVSVSEKAFALLMSPLGHARGYADEKLRQILQNVYPVRDDERKQENTSSLDFLEMHTEDGFLEEKCDFLGLSCLRSDHEGVARTGVASARLATERLPWVIIEDWLSKPFYRVKIPSSFMHTNLTELWSKPMAVLFGDLRNPNMCIDLDAMEATEPRAQRALEEFAIALKSTHVSETLVPGDVLIVDNNLAAHTRSGFRARYDGHDRWLQRLKVFVNPRASERSRKIGSHVCGPIALEPFSEILAA
jgi:L-asparagine oxygenase